MGKKLVYLFGNGKAGGSARMKELLGGKGANLAEMARLGLPVPPGFTISTSGCTYYMRHGRMLPGLKREVAKGMKFIENTMGRRFGAPENPLLVSVRSGARASMPGMMDTVLNLGLNDITVEGLARKTGNRRFALDAYRRLIQMFADVVLRTGKEEFEKILARERERLGVRSDAELPEEALERTVTDFKKLVKQIAPREFPQEPKKQLWLAIEAVFKSWENPRAKEYRRIYSIPDDWGTAANVQAMVFGNLGKESATGVVFTRNPANGERHLYGEYLPNAQGEDIVAGTRTPLPIAKLKEEMPEIYHQLERALNRLERHYREMMDVEWTVEEGRLWILQCRTGKRTPRAVVKIAHDMVRERLITKSEAISRIEPEMVSALLHKTIAPDAKYTVAAKGIPASPGAASGELVLFSQRAAELADQGRKVILVRHQTSADDVSGMAKAEGILTSAGGTTSHAAVVARGMGKPAVVGCEAIQVDYERRVIRIAGQELNEGAVITVNGSLGEVSIGAVPMVEPELSGEFLALLNWADGFRKLRIRANADTPEDTLRARRFGAEGIGLCRTEHMFFAPDRIGAMQEMILAQNAEERKRALEKLLPMQREDFCAIFRVMADLPVTIRALDPPLHEFLPTDGEQMKALAERLGISLAQVMETVNRLKEENPMLGFRGCRLGITNPEITAMQARAILEAACQMKREGLAVFPEVMIPLVSDAAELAQQRRLVDRMAEAVFKETGVRVEYQVGTMIEVPRAALLAEEIAQVADFFSFGTNDLTQLTFAFSRDDYGKFFPEYQQLGVMKQDPFETLDTKGVGALMRMAVKLGRKANPKLKIGICGEHGGDPATIEFCHHLGIDYVSCSPYRLPIARLVAGQAALGKKVERSAD